MNNNQDLYEKILAKVLNFIAYSSRSNKEVLDRISNALYRRKITDAEKQAITDQIMADLDKLQLINDEEYAKGYIEGQIRSGKLVSKRKISSYLYRKGIDQKTIDKYLELYTENMESDLISQLIQKKLPTIKDKDPRVRKQKLARYLMGKGFNPGKVFEAIDNLKEL
jgi:regulatory protein